MAPMDTLAHDDLRISLTVGDSPKGLLSRLRTNLLRFAGSREEQQRRILPNIVSADPAMINAVARAHSIKNIGYDISFTFLEHYCDSPHAYICAGRFGEMSMIFEGGAVDFFSQADALIKATSEVTERLLWSHERAYWQTDSIRAHWSELDGTAIDPHTVAGFSDEQKRKEPAFAYQDEILLWTHGTDLVTATPVLIPTQLVSAKHAHEARNCEPILRISISNGIATHDSFEQAAYHGLLELIERDAFMITYHNQLTPPRINPASIRHERIQNILTTLKKYRLLCDVVILPTDMPTTVVCCVLRDETGGGPALSLGAKAHHAPETAVVGAITEAYSMWHAMRECGSYAKPVPPPPWDVFTRMAFWGKPENLKHLSWLWGGPLISMPTGNHNAVTLQHLADAVAQLDCRAVAVPMSPPALQKLGVHSVCVVSPALQPMHMDSDPPYLGGVRLSAVPRRLGLTPSDTPPRFPHPFP